MPGRLVFHKGDSFPLYSLRNDGGWFSFDFGRFQERLMKLRHIVSVFHTNHVEIKRLEFFVYRVCGAYLINRAVNLQIVIVHDHHQIIQLPVTCKHGRLPDLAFLQLPVSKKRVYAVRRTVHLCRQGHPDRCRDPLPQRAAGHIHAFDMFHIRMPLKVRTDLAQREQILLGKIPPLCQNSVQSRRIMAL